MTARPINTKNLWYKNPILLILVIGMPLAMVLICIWFIVFAIKNQDSTVRDDWYMDGKALYQDASKDKLAYDLGVAAVMHFSDTTQNTQTVDLTLNYNDIAQAHYPATLDVKISHATDKDRDRDFTLMHTDGNHYAGVVELDTAIASKYYLQIEPSDTDKQHTGKQWRLIHNQKLPAKTAVFAPLPAFKPQPATEQSPSINH